jgi:hypothetical protein
MYKNYEIYTPAKLIARRLFIKSFKKSKENLRSSIATKSGLATPDTFSPLEVMLGEICNVLFFYSLQRINCSKYTKNQ